MKPIISVYFSTANTLSGQLDVYLIFLHTVHMCEYGPTGQFAHHLASLCSGDHSLVAIDAGHPLGIVIVMAAL